MGAYWLAVLVTVEQELAIKELFLGRRWPFKKKKGNVGEGFEEHGYSKDVVGISEALDGTAADDGNVDQQDQDTNSVDDIQDDVDNLCNDCSPKTRAPVKSAVQKLKLPTLISATAPDITDARKSGYMIVKRKKKPGGRPCIVSSVQSSSSENSVEEKVFPIEETKKVVSSTVKEFFDRKRPLEDEFMSETEVPTTETNKVVSSPVKRYVYLKRPLPEEVSLTDHESVKRRHIQIVEMDLNSIQAFTSADQTDGEQNEISTQEQTIKVEIDSFESFTASDNNSSPAVITEEVGKNIDSWVSAALKSCSDDNDEGGGGSDSERLGVESAPGAPGQGTCLVNPGAVGVVPRPTGPGVTRQVVIVRQTPTTATKSSATKSYFINKDGNIVLKQQNIAAVPTLVSKQLDMKKPEKCTRDLEIEPGIVHISELSDDDRAKHFDTETEFPNDLMGNGLMPALSKYYCVKCKYLFEDKEAFDSHKKKDCMYTCKDCNEKFTFRNRTAYTKHLIAHKLEKKLEKKKPIKPKKSNIIRVPTTRPEMLCQTCGLKFKSKSGYREHIRRHHENTPAPYNCCDIPFYSKAHYQRHRCRIHGDATPFLCDLCGVYFPLEGDLRRHVEQHETGKFMCDKCGAKLPFQGAYDDHMAMHNKEKNHQCVCGRKFTHRTSLCKHRRHCPMTRLQAEGANIVFEVQTGEEVSVQTS